MDVIQKSRNIDDAIPTVGKARAAAAVVAKHVATSFRSIVYIMVPGHGMYLRNGEDANLA
jgi:hypothetical protein